MDRIEYVVRRTRCSALNWPELGLNSVPLGTEDERVNSNVLLGDAFKKLPAAQLEGALDSLADRLGVDPASAESPMLDWPQVRELAGSGVTIGSHGESHICMTQLDHEAAVEELRRSRETIARETGAAPAHFGFPNGTSADFNDKLRAAAADAGYRSVASAEPGINVPGVTPPDNLLRVGLIGSPEQTMLYLERLLQRRGHAQC